MIRTIHRRLKGDPVDRVKQMDATIQENVNAGAKLIAVAMDNNVVYLTFQFPS